MSSSIRIGLKELLKNYKSEIDAVLISPADIPLIPTKVISQLIEHFEKETPKIIIPSFNRRKGHPILINSELFNCWNTSYAKRRLNRRVKCSVEIARCGQAWLVFKYSFEVAASRYNEIFDAGGRLVSNTLIWYTK